VLCGRLEERGCRWGQGPVRVEDVEVVGEAAGGLGPFAWWEGRDGGGGVGQGAVAVVEVLGAGVGVVGLLSGTPLSSSEDRWTA
jgi:hypothetical protein